MAYNIAYNFFIQILYAIKFLHENKIIHRDIKPENILLFEENTVKLCDFGWAIQTDKKLPPDSFFGTVEYMSPEIINHKSYDKKMDLWTLGILLYELIHSFSPFRPKKKEFSEDEVIENIRKHNIEFYATVSKECKKLILGLYLPGPGVIISSKLLQLSNLSEISICPPTTLFLHFLLKFSLSVFLSYNKS